MEHDIEECTVLSEIEHANNAENESNNAADDSNEPPKQIMLQPDHPLLQKFQQVLKEQLERQIQKISAELIDLESNFQKKEQERIELGEIIHSVIEKTSKQHEQIKENEIEIEKYATERVEMEKGIAEIRQIYDEKQQKLFESEKKEREIRNEVGAINFLMMQMTEWEEKLNTNLALKKRVSDRTKVEKKEVEREKRILDFIVYKLMTEIYRLENSIEHCNMIMEEQDKQRQEYAELIAANKNNIEKIEMEHKRLRTSLHSVVLAIEQRDKIYEEGQAILTEKQDKLRETVTAIDSLKKILNEEMEKEEQLAMEENTVKMEISRVNTKRQSELIKLEALEKEISDILPFHAQAQKEMMELKKEYEELEESFEKLSGEIKKQKSLKTELEKQLVKDLEGPEGDAEVKSLNKELQEKREINRELGIKVANMENNIATLSIEIDEAKRLNIEAEAVMKELFGRIKDQENKLNNLRNELKDLERRVKKKQIEFATLSKEAREMQQKEDSFKAVVEHRRKECNILEETNKKLQDQWLRQQNNFLKLSEERQAQLKEINTTRALNMLLYQEKIKLEDKLNELQNQEAETNKNLAVIRKKMDKLYSEIAETKDFKNNLDKDNDISRNDYEIKLKEADLECMKLEAQVADMDKEKIDLTNELTDLKKDISRWETDIKLTEELKKQVNQTKSSDDELSTMRIEIHRMTVRYGQLKKAQEKLIHDLNNCISKREFITNQAEAAEKRIFGGNKVESRTVYKRKLESIKAKLKKTQHETRQLEKKIEEVSKLESELGFKNAENEMKLQQQGEKLAKINHNIEVASFDRQKELDILLFKQHKLNAYMNICKGFYKKHFRSLTSLEKEYEKEQDINANLQAVVENLLVDFPNHYLVFNRILNILKLTSTQ